MKRTCASVLFALSLQACVSLSTSPVTQTGRDTYVVAAKASGNAAWNDVKMLALADAGKHCEPKKLNMVPIQILTSGVRGWSPQEARLTFKCVADDHPDWKNPPLLQERRG